MSNTYRSNGRRAKAIDAIRRAKAALAELEQLLLEQPDSKSQTPTSRPAPPSRPLPTAPRAPYRRRQQQPAAARASSAPTAPCERHRFGFGPCTCPPAVRP